MSASPDGERPAPSATLGSLAEIIRLVSGRDLGELRPEDAFVDDLRIDSLAMVEILEGASHHFGVRIEDEAAKHFVRVCDLVGYLDARAGSSTGTHVPRRSA